MSLRHTVDISAMTVFRHNSKPVRSHQTILCNPWHSFLTSFLCQRKGKKHSVVVYTPWDHFPLLCFDLFTFWLNCWRQSIWRSVCQTSLLYTSFPLPPHGDNTRKQPAEAYLSNKRALSGVSFTHPLLQKHAVISSPLPGKNTILYWHGTLWARGWGCVPAWPGSWTDLHTSTKAPLVERHSTNRLRKSLLRRAVHVPTNKIYSITQLARSLSHSLIHLDCTTWTQGSPQMWGG